MLAEALIGLAGSLVVALSSVIAAVVTNWKNSDAGLHTRGPMRPNLLLEAERPLNRAEQLFRQLLAERRKIAYIDAYQILLGQRPNPWRNQPHCREVIAAAQCSTPRVIDGLNIQLDALIVNQKGNQEPSYGYFNKRGFSRQQWRRLFGHWPLRRRLWNG